MKIFRCKNCNLEFEARGLKKEYHDPFFGPCVSYYAACPSCENPASEYKKPKPVKLASAVCGMPSSDCSSHGGSCGCCMN